LFEISVPKKCPKKQTLKEGHTWQAQKKDEKLPSISSKAEEEVFTRGM
jgi:hypothetical protein